MKIDSRYIGELQQALRDPQDGVVGFVDKLLTLCRDHQLDVEWSTSEFRLRSGKGEWQRVDELPRKSVFRAILARIATISHTTELKSISPYGGEGWIAIESPTPGASLQVKLTNTADDQRLSLEYVPGVPAASVSAADCVHSSEK